MLPGAFRRLLPAALALFLVGASGMILLVLTAYPVLWARWAFFLCLVAATAGLTMPLFAYLHHRFPFRQPVGERTVLREGLWSGLYLGFLGWLQLGRILTPWSALLVAAALTLLEALLLASEQSKKPF